MSDEIPGMEHALQSVPTEATATNLPAQSELAGPADSVVKVFQDVVGILQDGDADRALALGEATLQEMHESKTVRKYAMGGAVLPLKALEEAHGMFNFNVVDAGGRSVKRFVLWEYARRFVDAHNNPPKEKGQR